MYFVDATMIRKVDQNGIISTLLGANDLTAVRPLSCDSSMDVSQVQLLGWNAEETRGDSLMNGNLTTPWVLSYDYCVDMCQPGGRGETKLGRDKKESMEEWIKKESRLQSLKETKKISVNLGIRLPPYNGYRLMSIFCFCQVRLEWPTDLAVNPMDNSLYVLENNVILRITENHQVCFKRLDRHCTTIRVDTNCGVLTGFGSN